jgi:hypothetical protein
MFTVSRLGPRLAALASLMLLSGLVRSGSAPAASDAWRVVPPLYATADGPVAAAAGAIGWLYLGDAWSHDGGRTWHRARQPIGRPTAASPGSVGAVAPAASARSIAYAIVPNGDQLWRTTDGGRHWLMRSHPPGIQCVEVVSVDPANSRVVYVAGVDPCDGRDPQQTAMAERSDDGGATWSQIALPGIAVLPSFIDARRGYSTIAYLPCPPADSQADVMRVSQDGGASWTDVPTGRPLRGCGPYGRLVRDWAAPHGLYLLSLDHHGGFHTSDGMHWNEFGAAAPRVPSGTGAPVWLVDSHRPGVLLYELHNELSRSVDFGATWSAPKPFALTIGGEGAAGVQQHAGPDLISSVSAGEDAAGTIYASGAGSAASRDGGHTWQWRPADGGLDRSALHGLATDPSSGAVYAAGDAGIVRLEHGGAAFAPISPWGFLPPGFIAAPGFGQQPVVASGAIVAAWLPTGIVRLTDNARTVTVVARKHVSEIANVPGTRVVLGTTFAGGLRVSRDAGLHWRSAAPPPGGFPTFTGYLGTNRMPVLLAASTRQRLYRSTNLAASWKAIGRVRAFSSDSPFGGLAAATSAAIWDVHGRNLYVRRLPQQGSFRRALVGSASGISRVLIDGAHPRLAVVIPNYAADFAGHTISRSVFITRDSGTTWRTVSTPFPRGCTGDEATLSGEDQLVVSLRADTADNGPCPQGIALISPRLIG